MLVQPCLCRTCSETTLLVFPRGGSYSESVLRWLAVKNFRNTEYRTSYDVCICTNSLTDSISQNDIDLIKSPFLAKREPPCGKTCFCTSCINFFISMFHDMAQSSETVVLNEPLREKTNNLGFRPGPTQTGLCRHRSRLAA